ncbi:MAG: hypothetical protein IKN96_02275 [Oscillibacter sp.]|nr:hypothetical protein [Oscillibacter sp.]
MDVLMTAGTLRSHTKTAALQTRWNLKQESGNAGAHTDSLDAMLSKTPAASAAQAQIDGQRRGGEEKLKNIMEKVYAGKKLADDEKRFLKDRNPQAYAQMESAEQERKAYERELKRCRTKEEAQRAKALRIGAALARVNSAANNPAIPQDKKLEIVGMEKYRCAKLNETERAFAKRGDYAKLPTDAEKARAEKEERELRGRGAAGKADGRPEEGNSERPPIPDGASERSRPETTGNPAKPPDAKPEARAESDTLRKVRRAKRRAGAAAYMAIARPPEPLPTLQTEA